MEKLVMLVSRVPKGRVEHDDDTVDRLSHRYSVIIMVVFAVLLSMQQYVGKPIACWVPKEFTGSHTKYTNSYCWVKNTYFLALEEEIPKEHEADQRREIIYYQWMPFILLTQAFFFYVPHLIWRAMNSKAGVDSDNILDAAESFARAEKIEKKERTLALITNQIDRFLDNPKGKSKGGKEWSASLGHCISKVFCCFCGKHFGNYLTLLYIAVKFLYIGNVFMQLFVLNRVLKTNFNLFGVEAIQNAMDEQAWMNSTVFPKVTMCDFHIRRLGNVQRHTVQCLLPINLYVEKIYIFLWFWMVFVLAVSTLSSLMWIVRAMIREDRITYIKNHLTYGEQMNCQMDKDFAKKFVNDYLKQDGVFLLRLIGHNTDGLTATEIIGAVYDKWRGRQYIEPTEKPSPSTLPLKHRMNGGPKSPPPTAPPLPPYSPLDDVDSAKMV